MYNLYSASVLGVLLQEWSRMYQMVSLLIYKEYIPYSLSPANINYVHIKRITQTVYCTLGIEGILKAQSDIAIEFRANQITAKRFKIICCSLQKLLCY